MKRWLAELLEVWCEVWDCTPVLRHLNRHHTLHRIAGRLDARWR